MGLFDRFKKKPPVDPLTQEVMDIADRMVKSCASRTRGRLDYSEQSLPLIEELLEEAAGYTARMLEDELKRVVEGFGCYILEVGRRSVGGQYDWHQERDQPVLVVGPPRFEVAMLTWDRVRERLGGDAASAIPFFYEGFVSRCRTAEPGTRVLYV